MQLAVALSGRADAGAVLDSLEHDTSCCRPSIGERDGYRVQPQLRTYLLADVLARRATSCPAGSSTGLDRRAVIQPASDEPPTCQRTIIYDTHGPIAADAVSRSKFDPAEEKK